MHQLVKVLKFEQWLFSKIYKKDLIFISLRLTSHHGDIVQTGLFII